MGNRVNKIMLGLSVISMFIFLLSVTFSYFSVSQRSKQDAVLATAGSVRIGLGVSPLYTGHKIIPLRDQDVNIAYERECIDDDGYGACLAYSLEVFNYELSTEIEGIIDFELNGIENLSYMIFDDNNNVYKDITHIDVNNSSGLSLGNNFVLDEASDGGSTSKKFVLLLWLSDNNMPQDITDAGKLFSATITFRTPFGKGITANVDGIKDGSNNGSAVLEVGG